MTLAVDRGADSDSFRHEALFYEGSDDFVEWAVPFLQDGVAEGDAMLVVVDDLKIRRLTGALGLDASAVDFRPMPAVGRNPARIISAWTGFVEDQAATGRGLRGIGEPVWPERNAIEMDECFRHEQLLNVAFAGPGRWTLVCPYDSTTLSAPVLDQASRSHPVVRRGAVVQDSAEYDGLDRCRSHEGELPEPTGPVLEIQFSSADAIRSLRLACESQATRSGVADRAPDIGLALTEVATNSLRYGGGHGRARMWSDELGFCCEVSDEGHITDPLAGRRSPRLFETGGRGLWLANQMCDVVQIRSAPGRTVVRLRLWR